MHEAPSILIFTAGEDQEMARMCLVSVRCHHSRARVVHLTDMDTPALAGADEVRRMPRPAGGSVILLRLAHLVALGSRPWISLDSDILVRDRIDDAFEFAFDVALTVREFEPRYNAGVMFSRCASFWDELQQAVLAREDANDFTVIEKTLPGFVDRGRWDVLELPGHRWNCPHLTEKFKKNARVLHYKGERKTYMKDDFEEWYG